MKKYVILTNTVGGIGGGQIHTRNKMFYCREKGYTVYIFSGCYNKVLIEDLKPFQENFITEFEHFPDVFPKRAREKIIKKILEGINYYEGDDVIFECHEINLACWAEMVCQKIKGKNFVYLLGETFDKKLVLRWRDFLLFKYHRHELASIGRAEIMQKMFQPICELSLNECFPLAAASWNEAEDIEIPDRIKLGKECDKTIVIFGRLRKKFVLEAVKGVVNLAVDHSKTTFKVILIGGTTDRITDEERRLNKYISDINLKNLEVVETGAIYPVPKKLLQMSDVCISNSGSARVAGREVLTISLDPEGEAIGILGYDTMSCLVKENENAKTLEEYLEKVLFTDFSETADYKLLNHIDYAECMNRLEAQMEFIRSSDQSKCYFDFDRMILGPREIISHIIYFFMGTKGLNMAHNIRHKFPVREI